MTVFLQNQIEYKSAYSFRFIEMNMTSQCIVLSAIIWTERRIQLLLEDGHNGETDFDLLFLPKGSLFENLRNIM